MAHSPSYILGLAYSGNHASAAALLKNGELVAAAEEERWSKVKHDRSFPEQSIAFCLKRAGITIHDIQEVGFFWQPWRGVATRAWYAISGFPHSVSRGVRNTGILADLISAESVFRNKTGYRGAFRYIDHHITHASSVFFSSPFQESTILTLDGTGEVETCWMGVGNSQTLTKYKSIRWPHSLGHVYATATQYLGFKMFSDEYKVMGLAAYGTPKYLNEFRNIIQTPTRGTFTINLAYVSYHLSHERWYSDTWIRTFGPARLPNEPIDERHKDVAASLQMRLEEVVHELASHAIETSGLKDICLSGGVALNAVAVGKLTQSGIARRVFTNPVSGDQGCALGAAYYLEYVKNKNEVRHPLTHAYFGPAYTDQEIEETLKESGVQYEQVKNPAETAASLIAQGNIIGWFQERMEYGERALGNRSILADARNPTMKEAINARIKRRESFRPFAPAVLSEFQSDYFECNHASPFMTEVHMVRKEKRIIIPAVTHVDGSARIQSVNKKANPLFYELLKSFYALTGVPIVLNTSFNQNKEPIVESPHDALKTFKENNLDALIIGSFLVRRNV